MSGRGTVSKAVVPEEVDIMKLMEGIIDEEYIRNETGEEDLSSLVHLSLVIDTSVQSIYDLHHFLPSLQHLVLDNSTISTVRDLGIGLRFLKSLSLASCGLYDLDGIGVLTGLQELCLRDNHITDVTPLAMHENLETLNLSENKISDISIADSLSSCLSLRAVFLTRNPLSRARNYRLIVASLIPGLQMLDGTPVDSQAGKKVTNGMILESAAEMKMVEEDLDDEQRLENDMMGLNVASTDGKVEPASSPRPPFNGISTGSAELIPDTGSELTHGSSVVLAGNMAAAVRKRRQVPSDPSAPRTGDSFDQLLEYESTLDMLDAALKPVAFAREDSSNMSRFSSQAGSRRSTPRTDGNDAGFFKEGDITASVLNRASPQVDDDESPPEPYAAMSPQVRRRDLERMDRALKDGLASPLPRSGPKAATDKRGGSIAMSMSFEADVASSQQRPRTAAQRSVNGLPSPGGAVASPRQRNSSRPQSAISVGSPKHQNDDLSAYAAPFKVAVDKQRRADDVAARVDANLAFPPIKPNPAGSSIVHLDIVRRAPASSSVSRGGYMIAGDDDDDAAEPTAHSLAFPGMADDEEEDSETEDIAVTHAARHRLMATSSASGTANSVTSNLKSRQHILQQLKATASKADKDGEHSPDEHGQDVDGEVVAETAAEQKHRDEASATRFDIVGIAARGDNSSRGSSRRGSGTRAECVVESLEHSPHRPPPAAKAKNGDPKTVKDTMSSKAGVSLGFNLAGSLAAIDKWVQDMNSEGEDSASDLGGGDSSDDEAQDQPMVRKKSLLFALSLPHEKNVDSKGKHSDFEIMGPSNLDGNSKDSFSEYSAGSGAKNKNKILSRDAILSMCSGAGRDSARGSADSDEDSDMEVPDLRLHSSSRASSGRSAVSAQESDSRPDSGSQAAAPVRKRDADVRNRLRRGNSGTPRAAARRTEANGDADHSLLGDDADVAVEQRARPRRAVPDFPVDARADRGGAPVPIEEVSPPRYTAPARAAEQVEAAPRAAHADPEAGPAVSMTDTELVHLLRQQPKHTEQLRTKHNFQAFFKKIDEARMRSLLQRAYSDISESAERNEKVDKRMNLLDGFLS